MVLLGAEDTALEAAEWLAWPYSPVEGIMVVMDLVRAQSLSGLGVAVAEQALLELLQHLESVALVVRVLPQALLVQVFSTLAVVAVLIDLEPLLLVVLLLVVLVAFLPLVALRSLPTGVPVVAVGETVAPLSLVVAVLLVL
jgi:hypothetical protein